MSELKITQDMAAGALFEQTKRGSMVKKYLPTQVSQAKLGFSAKRVILKKVGTIGGAANMFPRKHYESRGPRYAQNVRYFYFRDDNNRNTSGKKDTVTRNEDKQQGRVIGDEMMNLHLKSSSSPMSLVWVYTT